MYRIVSHSVSALPRKYGNISTLRSCGWDSRLNFTQTYRLKPSERQAWTSIRTPAAECRWSATQYRLVSEVDGTRSASRVFPSSYNINSDVRRRPATAIMRYIAGDVTVTYVIGRPRDKRVERWRRAARSIFRLDGESEIQSSPRRSQSANGRPETFARVALSTTFRRRQPYALSMTISLLGNEHMVRIFCQNADCGCM